MVHLLMLFISLREWSCILIFLLFFLVSPVIGPKPNPSPIHAVRGRQQLWRRLAAIATGLLLLGLALGDY